MLSAVAFLFLDFHKYELFVTLCFDVFHDASPSPNGISSRHQSHQNSFIGFSISSRANDDYTNMVATLLEHTYIINLCRLMRKIAQTICDLP